MVVEMVGEAVDEAGELQVIEEAIALIDQALTTMQHRELISTDEMSNLLLDLRMLLTPLTVEALDDAAVPVTTS